MRIMTRAFFLLLLVSFHCIASAAPPTQNRAILLVWDSGKDGASETYVQLVEKLKALRDAGEFKRAPGLQTQFMSYDGAVKSHQTALQTLGISRAAAPFVGVVSVDAERLPVKLLWGTKVQTVDKAQDALLVYLNLEEPSSVTNAKDGSQLLLVKAGSFVMGGDSHPSESPRRTVELPGFYIGKYDVTNDQFAAFIKATGYVTEAEKKGSAEVIRTNKAKGAHWVSVKGANWRHPNGPQSEATSHFPVVSVTLADAQEYCRWAGVRLPSEQEWEKAARGSDARVFPWGDKWKPENCRNSAGLGLGAIGGTAPVGTFLQGASPCGSLDMAGNVFQWVSTTYAAYPGSTYTSERFGKSVIRGGAWSSDDVNYYRCSRRTVADAHLANSAIGFRVVKDI